MLFRSKAAGDRPAPLKPFVFRVREGFLIGLAMEPKAGAPCAGCVEKWLSDRDVWVEPVTEKELTIRRDLLDELIAENSGHTFYEISRDGSATKLECAVFPHPVCSCEQSTYLPPAKLTKRTNFAFSPLLTLSSERHGTPSGNLWVTSAAGPSPFGRIAIGVTGSGVDKETSRFRAIDNWLQKAAAADIEWRIRQGERVPSAQLQTGREDAQLAVAGRTVESLGAGKDRDEATLNALVQLSLKQTLKRYSTSGKNPMLVVGANNWLRERVPFFLLQRYDLHLLFYPNSTPCWVVGLAAFSRLKSDEKPIFVFAADTAVHTALEKALGKILEACPPSLEGALDSGGDYEAKGAKLNLWWTHWIYRCPKISLSDLLHLDPYEKNLEPWLGYWRDGQPPVTVTALNHPALPASLRTVVKLKTVDTAASSNVRSLHGIGTWSHFQDALI